jgi:bacteriocin biosynthesis cyclodehydratase domain-containing protein
VLPGIVGSLQANEALKLLVGYGQPLVGRLLTFDAQSTTFAEVKVRRDPACPACGRDVPAERHTSDKLEAGTLAG